MVDGRPREEMICSSTISALTVSTEVGIDGDVATDRTDGMAVRAVEIAAHCVGINVVGAFDMAYSHYKPEVRLEEAKRLKQETM